MSSQKALQLKYGLILILKVLNAEIEDAGVFWFGVFWVVV